MKMVEYLVHISVAAVEVCVWCLIDLSCWLIGNQPAADANRCACPCPYKAGVPKLFPERAT